MAAYVVVVDVFSFSFMLVCCLIGWMKGLSRQVFSWTMWIAGVYSMYFYLGVVTALPWVRVVENLWLRNVVVVMAWIFAIILASLLGQRLLRAGIDTLGLSGVDRMLGLFLGWFQAALILFVLVSVIEKTELADDPRWKTSSFVSYVQRVFPVGTVSYVDWAFDQAQHIHFRQPTVSAKKLPRISTSVPVAPAYPMNGAPLWLPQDVINMH